MKVTCILLLSLVLVCLFEDCEAWRRRRFRIRIRGRKFFRKVVVPYLVKTYGKRDALLSNPNLFVAKEVYDRYKAKKMQAELSGHHTCVADDVCGMSCIKNECTWYCDNICNIMADDKYNWRGELVALPCKFSAYDYTGAGYFYPADLAFHVNGRGRENDNMMVFKRLDQNGDGRVSESEFGNTKKHLLIDQETC
ncbi:EF-hand calcium-binding domain-containing protein 1-like [Mytilus edulis]|uniref:EF-hand calcium-binding domain-containing protein 1-like n=1 Tax=Mytilus edulis TaxID=6550 RepID=UPI0039F06A7C